MLFRLSWINLLFLSLAQAGETCSDALKIQEAKEPHPISLSVFLGKERNNFPCAEAQNRSIKDFVIKSFLVSDRIVIALTSIDTNSFADLRLLPKIKRTEKFSLDEFECWHKVPHSPAIAYISKKNNSVKTAWVIDRDIGKILPVPANRVECKKVKGPSP